MNEMTRNWVNSVKMSAPDYAEELITNLESAMSQHELTPVVANACALAAAIASDNGNLAFEISMDKSLFGNDIRDTVARAVLYETVNSRHDAYSMSLQSEGLINSISEIEINEFVDNGNSTSELFTLFCLVTAIATSSRESAQTNLRLLRCFGINQSKIDQAAKIASVVSAIGKCLI